MAYDGNINDGNTSCSFSKTDDCQIRLWDGRRWQAQQWWGELVGPHGTGKTTLRRTVLAIAGAENVPDPKTAPQLAERHNGNLRLMLFELYDQWEAQRKCS